MVKLNLHVSHFLTLIVLLSFVCNASSLAKARKPNIRKPNIQNPKILKIEPREPSLVEPFMKILRTGCKQIVGNTFHGLRDKCHAKMDEFEEQLLLVNDWLGYQKTSTVDFVGSKFDDLNANVANIATLPEKAERKMLNFRDSSTNKLDGLVTKQLNKAELKITRVARSLLNSVEKKGKLFVGSTLDDVQSKILGVSGNRDLKSLADEMMDVTEARIDKMADKLMRKLMLVGSVLVGGMVVVFVTLTMLGCGVAGVQKGTLAYRVQKRSGLVDDKEQIPEIEPEERESFNKTLV